METTAARLRRQGRLLQALLDHAEEEGDRGGALEIFAEQLEERIGLMESSVFPWIERHVGQAFEPIVRLQAQHQAIQELLRGGSLAALRVLLDEHLAEEERVLWPMVENAQPLRPAAG